MKIGTAIALCLLFCTSIFGIDSLFHNGLKALSNQEYTTAENIFSQLSEKQPSFISFYNLGIAAGTKKEWNKAKWAFESALKYNPSNKYAQYNAAFATNKLNTEKDWVHPYSWFDRIFLKIGNLICFIMALISSIFLGYILFKFFANNFSFNIFKNRKTLSISILSLCIFIFSLTGIIRIHQHFAAPHYILFKSQPTSYYVSPNGIKIHPKVSQAQRYNIQVISPNQKWIKVANTALESFWVKAKDVFIY